MERKKFFFFFQRTYSEQETTAVKNKNRLIKVMQLQIQDRLIMMMTIGGKGKSVVGIIYVSHDEWCKCKYILLEHRARKKQKTNEREDPEVNEHETYHELG